MSAKSFFTSKLLAVIGLAALFGVIATGCGDDANGGGADHGEAPLPKSLVGAWVFHSVHADGMPADLRGMLEWDPGTAVAELLILEDGSFVYREVDGNGVELAAESGVVSVREADEIDLIVQRGSAGPADGMLSFLFAVADDTLTLRETGGSLVFTLLKAQAE
ncbi:MAG: hypothetical protein AAF436_14375 [Myxococcota bacterium]